MANGRERSAAQPDPSAALGGLTFSAVIAIIGIGVMLDWSFSLGLIIALLGLIAFGGYALGMRH